MASPDAAWVAYAAGGSLRFRSLLDGTERDLGPAPEAPPPLQPSAWESDVCSTGVWSPDGRWFAWMRTGFDATGPWPFGVREVLVLPRDAQSAADAVLVGVVPGWGGFGVGADWQALVWSPDGRWVDSWRGAAQPMRVPAVPAPSGAAAKWPGRHQCVPADLTCQGQNQAYHWSPNEMWVLYLDSPAGPPNTPGDQLGSRVRLARLDGTADVELTAFSGSGFSGLGLTLPESQVRQMYTTYHTSLFSTDGRFVDYVDPEGALWSIELATGRRSLLDTRTGIDPYALRTVPAWRPTRG